MNQQILGMNIHRSSDFDVHWGDMAKWYPCHFSRDQWKLMAVRDPLLPLEILFANSTSIWELDQTLANGNLEIYF